MGVFRTAARAAATDPEGVRGQVDGLAALMRSQLGARGTSLRDTLHHSGHALPAPVRSEAIFLADCAEMAGHPRLIQRLDAARMIRAEDTCRAHLQSLGRWSRRGAVALAVLRRLALIGLVTAALALGLAIWRGLL